MHPNHEPVEKFRVKPQQAVTISDFRSVISKSEVLGDSRKATIVLRIREHPFILELTMIRRNIVFLENKGNSKESTSGILIL